ncbi:MAG: Gfo/Idh/MocA family oxidoreductase [Thermoguttaceae bacterium]|jgi:predicted dehydrogenase|nr:Gfo/Idh/MocA family oxidoreductase [Thermoguttaceae bacterium]
MTTRFSRRKLLATSALAAVTAATKPFKAPYVLADASPNAKAGVAVIGAANQGSISVNEVARLGERFVAFADIDERQYAKTQKTLAEYPDVKFDAIPRFFDYRKMFDKMHKQIDVVFVCAPDHHHATASMIAMKLGKGVYCEKPLAHSIHECRVMAEAAQKYKVTTQLGNQGHSREGIRRLCEYLWAGAIGKVTEVHAWAPTGRGGTGGRLPTKPVPQGVHWDEWIGPAQYRDYHDELHPALWRSWWEFGDGSLGDWGCHNLDGAFWALHLGHPTSAEAIERIGGSDERFPLVNVVRWDFPARGELPPVKVFWYDGYRAAKTANPKKELGDAMEKSQNRPPIVLELEKKYNRQFGDGGTIYVGDQGIMFSGNYCDSPRIIPEEKHRQFPVPEKKLPRLKGTHQADFLRAFKEGTKACSDFEYGARLTEMLFVGCLAERAGLNQKVEWDGAAMKVTNLPELNRMVKREYRKGWEL